MRIVVVLCCLTACGSSSMGVPDLAGVEDLAAQQPDLSGTTCTPCGSACVSTDDDVRNCGGCYRDCTFLPGVDPTKVSCRAGVCVLTNACAPGRAHCSANPTSGCETDTTLPAHCGGCGQVCLDPTPLCSTTPDVDAGVAAGCVSDCGAASLRCDHSCVDPKHDPNHCGDCATRCTAGAPNTVARCDEGVCATACIPGYHLCGGSCVANTSVTACGASCSPCPAGPPNSFAVCDGVACGFACLGGFHDCGGACVSDDSPAHCGSRCTPCAGGSNATTACVARACAFGCDPGFADCDGMAANGCETALGTIASCSACSDACTAGGNATPICSVGPGNDGTCGISCAAHFGDCDHDGKSCEQSLITASDCGDCGAPCNINNGSGDCSTGQCTLTSCDLGFADCNADPKDGCETLVNTLQDCGYCGALCAPTGASVADCSTGTCTILGCQFGVKDCNFDATDGCETDVTKDLANCGDCNAACVAKNHATKVSCDNTQCDVLTCAAGFADCNHSAADGCETDLLNDPQACGTCAWSCGPKTCVLGTCQ